jgi:uncharacterized membrane protein YeaQ/YmgE (transglycosylase-associated protein family)
VHAVNILGWIILGGISGWVATSLMRSEGSAGCCMNVIIGIIGAVVGGLIFHSMGGQAVSDLSIYSLVVSTVGAVVVLAIVNAFRR